MPDNRYIVQKGRGWYIRLAVPPRLVAAAGGKTHVVKSLETRDVVVARRRRWAAIANAQAWLQALDAVAANVDSYSRGGTADPIKAAMEWRESREDTEAEFGPAYEVAIWRHRAGPGGLLPVDGESGRGATGEELVAELNFMAVAAGINEDAAAIEQKQGRRAADTFKAYGSSPPLVEIVEQWLEEIEGDVTEQTRGHHGFAVRLLQEQIPAAVLVEDVDRRRAGEFVSYLKLRSGKQPKTQRRIISSLSSFWKWLGLKGFAESNPWEGQTAGLAKRRGTKKSRERAFTPAELVKLLAGETEAKRRQRPGKDELALRDLAPLALVTGCRLNELADLRAADVDASAHVLNIPRGKTEAAERAVPVHEWAWPIMARRLAGAVEGVLFHELKPGGPDKKRSWNATKAFTTVRRRILGEDDTVDFHSLRRCFATYLDRAQAATPEVNPTVIAELMGHEKPTLATAVYSGGMTPAHRRRAVDAMAAQMEPEVVEALKVAVVRQQS